MSVCGFLQFSFVLVEYFTPLRLSDARFIFIFTRIIRTERDLEKNRVLISVKILLVALVRLPSEREIYEQMIVSVMSFSNFLSF